MNPNTPTTKALVSSSSRVNQAAAVSVLAVGLMTSACDDDHPYPHPIPGETPTKRVFDALGGYHALVQMTSISFVASGDVLAQFQGHDFDDIRPINTFTTNVKYLPDDRRLRLEHTRTVDYPFDAIRTITQVFEGDTGWTEGNEGIPIPAFAPGDMAPNKAAAYTTVQNLLNPHMLLRRVLDGELTAEDAASETIDGTPYSVLTVDLSGLPLKLYVDETTHELTRLITTTHDNLVCDSEIEVQYQGWIDVDGGLSYPTEVTIVGLGGTLYHETRTELAINDTLDEQLLALPPEATAPVDAELTSLGIRRALFHHTYSNAGVPFPMPQTDIESVELAPGVFFLVGTHNSIAVEQDSRIILIEAPLAEDRSIAIANWAHDQFPGKEISHVVVTHHHVDHSGGLRHFVAEGATVVSAEASVDFLNDASFGATCTIIPDALSTTPSSASFDPVPMDGMLIIEDPINPVEVYQIDSEHAMDMTITYLPNIGAVFNSDLYSPFPPELRALGIQPFFTDQDLLDLAGGIETFALTPTLMIGGHGGVTSIDEFNADVATVE